MSGGVFECQRPGNSARALALYMKTNKAKENIIALGNKRFAPSASALVDTLFSPHGTADGIYSIRKNGVLFQKPNGSPFVFLVNNSGRNTFFVSCSRQEDKKIRYQFTIDNVDKRALGIEGLSFSEQITLAENIMQTIKSKGGA